MIPMRRAAQTIETALAAIKPCPPYSAAGCQRSASQKPAIARWFFSQTERAPLITAHTLNPKVISCESTFLGETVAHAERLQDILHSSPSALPFDEIINCSIGVPHSSGQQSITFFQEVLSLCNYPGLLDKDGMRGLFSSDSIDRAKRIISSLPDGATGGHARGKKSFSKGLQALRATVAEGIETRDGFPANMEDIFLTDGSSPAVHMIMRIVIASDRDGILCPVPYCPLYSSSISLHGGALVPYYLNETAQWSLEISELRLRLESAFAAGINVKALIIINPGNPSGQVLSEANQQEIVQFCKDEQLVLLADEVYQENVYTENKFFISFKKIARSMGYTDDDFSLVSFHSISKGYYGEGSKRGGYMEVTGLDRRIKEQLYKMASINLCSNLTGQILMSLVMNPPKMFVEALNKLDGVSCNEAEGGLYLYPSIELPKAALKAARKSGMEGESFYCRQLLDSTGIMVVPGSHFGQVSGTYHFRITICPLEEKVPNVLFKLANFHRRFMQAFGS